MFIATGVGVIGGHVIVNSLIGGKPRPQGPPQHVQQQNVRQGTSGIDSLKNQSIFSNPNNNNQSNQRD